MAGRWDGYVAGMSRDLPVTAIMTTDVVTVRPEMPLEDAAALLAERGVSGAPVVDASGRLQGMLDDTDLLTSTARLHAPTTIELLGAYIPLPGEYRRYTEELRHALAQTVADVMEEDLPSVGVSATCEDAATLMIERGVSRVAVVDSGGGLAGIVTRGDLVRGIALDRLA